jgi:GT2 family glycosyltransferase/glycosyltransferase involved in cell wall biosynthesis
VLRGAAETGDGGGPDVSVVIVTWNVRELVVDCLRAIAERSGALDVEAIVVDNGSSDGTVRAVRAAYPRVTVIANGGNVGFPAANNQGLAHAAGRHVLFLNPDTVVGEGTIEACTAALDRDAGIGMVGCRLMYPSGRVQFEGGRRDYRLRHLLYEALYLQELFPRNGVFAHQLMGSWDHRGERDVEAISGAFMMVRAEVARALGGLPSDMFMYHEDLAFALRVRRAGWRIRYLGGVETVHYGGASRKRSTSPLSLLEGEVRVRLIRERGGPLRAALARPLFGVRSIGRLAAAATLRFVPGLGALKERRAKAFDVRLHALHLLWSVAPGTAERLLPRPDEADVAVVLLPRRRPPVSAGPADAERLPLLLVIGPVPPPPHGTSVYVRLLLESPVLARRWRVQHLDTSDRRSLENLGRVDLGNVGLGLAHAGRLAVRLLRDRPQVVWIPLSQNAPAYLRDALFVVLARLGGARVVGHLHGGWFHEFHRRAAAPVRWLIRWSCRMLAAAWVLGPNLTECFAGLVPAARVRVVPNGVPDPRAGARPAGPRSAFTVLYLGQLSDQKGVDDLLAAFGTLSAPEARLLLAGEWLTRADERRIRAAIDASPARARIELVGPVDAAGKARCLAQADVLALPTRQPEGQPLVILEAMAAGLPVVATRRGAIADMVRDGVTGLLVPEADPAALAAALDRLERDRASAAALGEEGRRRWAHEFTDEQAMTRVAEALADLEPARVPASGARA